MENAYKAVVFVFDKELFGNVLGNVFHLSFCRVDAVPLEICGRVGGKGIGDFCFGSILLLCSPLIGSDGFAVGHPSLLVDDVW